MSSLVYKTHDVYDFSDLSNPLDVGKQPLTSRKGYDRHEHPNVGLLEYRNVTFPHIHVMDLRWTARTALKLVNEVPTDAISFVFQISGINDVTYLRAEQNIRVGAAQHYMVYHPDGEFYNISQPNATARQLLVSVARDFFAGSLGCDSVWAESVQRNLERKNAFLSSSSPMQSTPRIQQLVQAVADDQSRGPMRNFMVQSRAMELIAAHIDLVNPVSSSYPGVSSTDVERLQLVKLHLEHSFLENHSLHHLSRLFSLNEFKLKKGFRTLFGVSVFGFIKSLRMDYATSLLRDSKFSVDEVAFLLGYEYAQHFSAAYKKHTGLSPSKLRC